MATLIRPSQTIPPAILEKHLLPDLEVRHTRDSPVFIVGQPRSGTSIFARLFRKYLKVNFGPESQFFIRVSKDLSRFGDLSRDQNALALIEAIAHERCFQRNQFDFAVDPEAVLADLPERRYSAVVATIFRHFARHNGMVRWGDKTPEYIEHLDTLRTLFPDAQYIHIVRDGRDVALSQFKTHFGPKNRVVAALEWQRNVDLLKAFAIRVPTDQFTEVRYEDLIEMPEAVFRHLIRFLGIEDPYDHLGRFIENRIPLEFKRQNYGKWRQGFSRRAKRDYERVAFEGLIRYDYPTVSTKKPSPMTALEKAFWKMKHLVKKAATAGYWQDNLYKGRLRIRPLTERGVNRP